MALHGWGQAMSIAHVATELGISPIGLSLGDSRVRNLLGDTGAVYLSNAYGKSNAYTSTISLGNSGITTGVYRPNAGSGWVYGSVANSIVYGTPLIWMTWEVDRFGGTGDGEFYFANSIGAKLKITVNERTFTTSDNGGGRYSIPAEYTQFMEDSVGGLTIQIIPIS